LNPLRKYTRHGACVLLIACLAPMASRAGDDAMKVRAIVDATIRPLMSQHDIPGMAVGVMLDGQAYVLNYGLASREHRTPVVNATLFEIGSVSKTLTVTLATYAQAIGKLSLSDHPGRYVPALKGRSIDQATLLHLGTYTAGGLPLQFPDDVANTNDGAIAYLSSWKAYARAGTEREYSNPSLGLLGYATGIAMRDGFARSMETQLLPRLGMDHTYVHVPAAAMADYAWGEHDGKAVRAGSGPFDEEAYGIKTTAGDMLRFMKDNMDPSGLEPAMRRAAKATHTGYFRAGDLVQGLGWEQYPWPLSRELLLGGNSAEMIEHPNAVIPIATPTSAAPHLFDKTGSTGGFGAYVAFIPSSRLGIVMLANKNYPIPARVEAAYAILDKLAAGQRQVP